jgi:hypothetical protein
LVGELVETWDWVLRHYSHTSHYVRIAIATYSQLIFAHLFLRIATPFAQNRPFSFVARLFPPYSHVFALIRNGTTIHTIHTLFAHDPRTVHGMCRSCVALFAHLFAHYSALMRALFGAVRAHSHTFTRVPTCRCDVYLSRCSPPRRCRKRGRGAVWRRPQSHLRRFFCAIFFLKPNCGMTI